MLINGMIFFNKVIFNNFFEIDGYYVLFCKDKYIYNERERLIIFFILINFV